MQQQKLQESLEELKVLQRMIGTRNYLTIEEQGEETAVTEGRLAEVDLHLAELTGSVIVPGILRTLACPDHQ
jgi:hypothetical protein